MRHPLLIDAPLGPWGVFEPPWCPLWDTASGLLTNAKKSDSKWAPTTSVQRSTWCDGWVYCRRVLPCSPCIVGFVSYCGHIATPRMFQLTPTPRNPHQTYSSCGRNWFAKFPFLRGLCGQGDRALHVTTCVRCVQTAARHPGSTVTIAAFCRTDRSPDYPHTASRQQGIARKWLCCDR